MEDESLPGAPTPPSDSALVAMPPTPPGVITVSKPTGGDAAAEVDPETRAAVADLIATNRKLRRAVKERDAERSTLRAETEKLKKELSEATVSQQQHSEDLVSVRCTRQCTSCLFCILNLLSFFCLYPPASTRARGNEAQPSDPQTHVFFGRAGGRQQRRRRRRCGGSGGERPLVRRRPCLSELLLGKREAQDFAPAQPGTAHGRPFGRLHPPRADDPADLHRDLRRAGRLRRVSDRRAGAEVRGRVQRSDGKHCVHGVGAVRGRHPQTLRQGRSWTERESE